MAHLPLVPASEFPADLAAAVQRGVATRMLSSTVPMQVWAHKPDAAVAWLNLLDRFHNHGLLDSRLRELVRLRVSTFTNCKACQAARKSDAVTIEDLACLSSDDPAFSPAERSALRYVESFMVDPMEMGADMFDELKQHFSVPEIVELNMFTALMLAGGRMTLVQKAYDV